MAAALGQLRLQGALTSRAPERAPCRTGRLHRQPHVAAAAEARSRTGASFDDGDDLPDLDGASSSPVAFISDELTSRYKALDESIDKQYIETVVSLREVILAQEWHRHGKALAERRGVCQFERHCADNDIEVSFEAITRLYKQPHDMSVLPAGKLRLLCRSMVMETLDERYCQIYAEATAVAKELANTGIKDILPESAEKVGGVMKELLPLPRFVKQLF